MEPPAGPTGPPLRLCYILSSGRSGSTLLDLLLGSLPGLFTLGELQVLPFEVQENRSPCGCGEFLHDCPFWAPLLPKLEFVDERARLTQFRDTHTTGRVLRREHFGDVLAGRVGAPRTAAADGYSALNEALLDQVAERVREHTGAAPRWLVDASKDPYRLLWLSRSRRIELRVIHLVKDPRAFVHSITRRARPVRPSSVARYSARWAIENSGMARLGERLGDNAYRRISYEQLSGEPDTTLQALGRWLGVEVPADASGRFREAENHAVAGNQMRWQDRGIELDASWRTDFPGWARMSVGLLTHPARLRLARRHEAA